MNEVKDAIEEYIKVCYSGDYEKMSLMIHPEHLTLFKTGICQAAEELKAEGKSEEIVNFFPNVNSIEELENNSPEEFFTLFMIGMRIEMYSKYDIMVLDKFSIKIHSIDIHDDHATVKSSGSVTVDKQKTSFKRSVGLILVIREWKILLDERMYNMKNIILKKIRKK